MVDPVDTRYDTISRSLATARNEAIFLNLVRASHDYPLSFTTISQVTPSMTNTSSLALPSFLVGPGTVGQVTATAALSTFPSSSPYRDTIFGNTTASNSTAVSSNFNVATQETSAFYEGFLRPIDLQVLDYFIRQGYSRELLYWLFADTVELKIGHYTVGMRYDPPKDYGCDRKDPRHLCFPDIILIATAAGLTVEEQTLESSGGGGASKGGGGNSSSSGKGATTIFARFCFDAVLARRSQGEMGDKWRTISKAFDVSLASPKCGSHWDPVKDAKKPQPDTLNFSVGPYEFKVTPRSAFGVFEFLGTLMKIQRNHAEQSTAAYIPPGRLDVLQPPTLATAEQDPNLITIAQSGTPQCFVHTWFYDGEYCVPEDATTTKRIFSLLAQLIAIQTAASDLSITPIVRVVQ
ncbi:MAG: hypothetical protein WCA56_18610 [Xanthobacteraceae bacterium]